MYRWIVELFIKSAFYAVLALIVLGVLYVASKLSKTHSKSGALLATLIFCLVFWPIFPGLFNAEYQCNHNARLKTSGKLPVEGYFTDPKYEGKTTGSLSRISNLLLNEGFLFTEEPVNKDSRFNFFAEHANGEGDYFRYYIAPITSTHCNSYNKYIFLYKSTVDSLERQGLKKDQCIAVERVENLKSDYELRVISEPEYFPSYIPWRATQIVNIKTGEVHSEYRFFHYKAYEASKLCYALGENMVVKTSILVPSNKTANE